MSNLRTTAYNLRAIAFLASVAASLLIVGQAVAAYEVKVNLNTLGGGTGRVIFSATSSSDFEFSGWTGESCIGKGTCLLRDLIPKSSKIVIASFNTPTCAEFVYSEFGTCQLDGTRRRTVISAGPPGCQGGNPALTTSCFYNPCAFGTTVQGDIGAAAGGGGIFEIIGNAAKNFGNAIAKGDLGGAANALLDGAGRIAVPGLYTKTPPDFTSGGYLPYLPPSVIGGGVPTKDGKFDVIMSGGIAGQKGGSVIFLPPAGEPTPPPVPALPKIPDITLPGRDAKPIEIGPYVFPPRFAPEIDLLPQEPIIITAPYDRQEFNFGFDYNFGKDPTEWCRK